MNKNFLVRIFGFPATLIHGDTLMLDRWYWVKKRFPKTKTEVSVLDVGCGSGAFSIGIARRGYSSLGLTWDENDQQKAVQRAKICKAPKASFSIQDVRNLHERTEFLNQFDRILCLENIEHILNDTKLIQDMSKCLKPGGKLFLTTPNFNYRPITKEDRGPFHPIETGWHVRKGYTPEDLQRLCDASGLSVEEIGYVSGFLSQKITWLFRKLNKINPVFSFIVTSPFRIFPPLLDKLITKLTGYPGFCISLVASRH